MNPVEIRLVEGKGRGVFSTRSIKKNTIIGEYPVIVLDKKDSQIARDTLLKTYLFDWPSKNENLNDKWTSSAILLGIGSLFNHSEEPNIKWKINRNKLTIIFQALRSIFQNEELVFNYEWPLEFWTNTSESAYDKNFGDDKLCQCGHQYYRHFDSYEDMEPVGCKYCECREFKSTT